LRHGGWTLGKSVATEQFLAQSVLCFGPAPQCTVRRMPRLPVVTFHILPVPTRDVVTVMVFERGHRVSGGMFEVSTAAWERARRCLTPDPGLRIRDYPPYPRRSSLRR
jgi:hypothetical protein